jgi:hypothetical protein
MTTISGVVAGASLATASSAPTGPVSVAAALASLRLRPGSTVAISDTAANIQKNLDTLQGVAGRITSLASNDGHQQLQASAAQYQKDAAILAKWGATDGNSVEVTGVAAAAAAAFAASRATWVNSFTVADSSANLARNLDSLQTLVAGGSLRQIVHTGSAAPLSITAAQMVADADALGAIKNQAYTLAVNDASVSDTLGLDGQGALTANAKVKSIRIKDSTAAIEDHLDALQRVGLRLKSITQTDAASDALTLTASQLGKDAVVVGKIISPYQLEVMRATASQVAKLAANQKVVSVSVADTAANIAKRWNLMDRLSTSLASVEVTDPNNAIALSADQLVLGEDLLAKFADDADHTFSLAVRDAKAGQAAGFAALGHVAAIGVTDTADNVAANLADLKAVDAQGQLQGMTLTGKLLNIGLDAAQLLGDQAASTQSLLDKVNNRNFGVAASNATLDQLDDLAANGRVVSMSFNASSDEIEARIDSLGQLGGRLTRIEQTDSGTALDVTQSQFDTRAAVLAKVAGGYSVNITGASAARALADAVNAHVASVSVEDTGRNLVTQWRALRAIGSNLAAVTKTDDGALSLSASNYLLGVNDGLTAKFSADQRFAITGATVEQALQAGQDSAVSQIDVADEGGLVTSKMTELAQLVSDGKLNSIVLGATTTRLSLHASQLADAQPVLDLVKDGRYTLALDQVDVANLGDLLNANGKIATVRAQGDAAGIVANLGALNSAGHKLLAISRTDSSDTALALTGADFGSYRATLAKISGGYQAELSEVGAARAAGLAALAQVKTLQVADSGANLVASWNALGAIGAKLTGLAQSDDAVLNLGAGQWAATHALGDKFSTPLALAISGATVADLAALGSDNAVQQIQLRDNADAVASAWSDLAAQTKLTQLQITDPGTAMAMSAGTYAASGDLFGLISDHQYSVALSDAALADAATLQADAHVASMDLVGSSTDIAAAFDDLGAMGKLGTLALSDDNGTLNLSAAQVLGGAELLGKIGNGYQLAASGATLADLPGLAAVDNLASIGVADSAANVAAQLDDLSALGAQLASVTLSDDSPVLALTQTDFAAGSAALAKIGSSYQVDLSEVDPAAVATLAADGTVRQLAVTGTAGGVAQQWSALVAAYGDGSGKLAAITLSDDAPLQLTEAQQTEGATMISALLGSETIVTLG